MFSRLVLIATVLVVGACTTQSPYTPADSADAYGYYSTPLGADRYRVSFNGNTATGQNTVTDYALLRAAELTAEQGMDWFQIVERATNRTEESSAGAGVSHRTGPAVQRDCGLLGCTTTMRPEPRTAVGVDTGTSRTSYSVSLEIVMGNGPMPENDGRYYDAEELVQSLWEAM